MARKRNNSAGNILIYVVVLVLIVSILLIWPILLVVFFVYRNKNKRLEAVRVTEGFNLNASERKLMNKAARDYNAVSERIVQIGHEGNALSTRKDGYYSERSKLGKTLNAELQKLEPNQQQLHSEYLYFEQLPQSRFDEWLMSRSLFTASKSTLFFYAVFLMGLSKFDMAWVANIDAFVREVLMLVPPAGGLPFFGLVVVSSIVSLIYAIVVFYVSTATNAISLEDCTGESSTKENYFAHVEGEQRSHSLESLLRSLAHVELKKIVDEVNVDVDKRSKDKIIEALIKERHDEVKILLQLA